MTQDQKIGIELVVEGLRQFERHLLEAQGEVDGLAGDIERVEQNTIRLDDASLLGFGAMQVAADLAHQAIMRVVDGVSQLVGDTVNVAADFEAQMALMQTASGLSGEELEEVRQFAIDMGKETFESAQGAAEGMTNLFKAGMDAQEVMEVFPSAADLAAASGMSLADASDAVVVAMKTFGKDTGDAAEISDTFVRSADASVAEVSDLVAAVDTVGPVAADMGISLEEVNIALALLSEQGITGAEAGNALKSMLLNMTRPVDGVTDTYSRLNIELFDAQGNMRSLPNIIGDMGSAFEDLTDEQRIQESQTIAGSFGIRALNALVGEGIQGWQEMSDKVQGASSAQEVAETRMNTLKGAIEEMQGGLETLQVTAGTEFNAKVVRPIVDGINDEVLPAVQDFTEALIGPEGSLQAALDTLVPEGEGGGVGEIIRLLAENLDSLFETLQEMSPEELENLARGVAALFAVFNAKALLGAVMAGGPLVLLFLALASGAEELAGALEALGEGDFQGVLEGIVGALVDIAQDTADLLGIEIDVEGNLAAWEGVRDNIEIIWDTLFNPETGILPTAWNNFWNNIVPNAPQAFLDWLVFFFTGEEEGSIPYAINSFVETVTQIWDTFWGPDGPFQSVVRGAVDEINRIIKEVETAINGVLTALGLAQTQADNLDASTADFGSGPPPGFEPLSTSSATGQPLVPGQLPARQPGGPVEMGLPYLVGESGAELFVPRRAGMILPAGQTARMSQDIHNNQRAWNVNFYGPVGTPQGVVDRLRQAAVMNGI